MMYDFEKELKAGEKIIYKAVPIPGSSSKGIGKFILLFGVIFLSLFLMIYSLVTKTGDGANGLDFSFVVGFLVLFVFIGFGMYALFYNLFIKKKKTQNVCYCLTNYRAMSYDFVKQEFRCGYLSNFDNIFVEYDKNGYGDVYFEADKLAEFEDDPIGAIKFMKEQLTNADPSDLYAFVFESIKDPHKICSMATKAKEDLKRRK